MKRNLLFLFFVFLLFPCFASAINMFDVVINEIAWMGTTNSANDEWMELKNKTDNPINLSGWTLQTADEKIVIKLSGTVPANGFYLLERTDDTTVPNITADQIYTGALNNNGQDLWLYDAGNNIIDEADFYSGWTFGDNTTKQTMERIDKENWKTSRDAGGTPHQENSLGANPNDQIPNSKQIQNLKPEIQNPADETTAKIYPDGIVINEILPNPEGSDEADEWVELYNSNNFEVDLSGWKIQDTQGTITTYNIPKNTIILANGFLLLKRPDIKIMLNNDEDGLTVLNPDNKLVDSVEYAKAPLGQSYNKSPSDWQWSTNLTPGATNIITAAATKAPSTSSGPNGLPKEQKSDKNDVVELGLASLNQNQEEFKNNSPWFLFFTALAITLISATAVLIIKLKFLKKNT